MSDFSMEQATLELNGHTFTGWSDDADALSMPTVDLANIKRGADGKMTATSTGDKGGPVVIKLLPNSPSASFMMRAVAAQQNGASVKWNGTWRDSINQVVVALAGGVLSNAPLGQTLGKGETANLEFTIEFERVTPDYQAATFV